MNQQWHHKRERMDRAIEDARRNEEMRLARELRGAFPELGYAESLKHAFLKLHKSGYTIDGPAKGVQ